MKFEEFWEIYLNEDIVENYEAVKEVFSKEIEINIEEEYDVSEVLVEFLGHHEEAKEFEKIIEFTKILRQKNARVFMEVFPYYDDFLIDYYCYHREFEKLEQPVKDFLKLPLQDYDLLLKSLRKLIYYGKIEIGEKLIEKIYEEVKDSPEIMPGAEFDLALFKYQIELEKAYERYKKDENFGWSLYKENLKRFDFEIKEEYLSLLEEGFTKSLENLGEKFLQKPISGRERGVRVELLEKGFMRYMKENNMSFPVSGSIWNYLYEYWENGKKEVNPQKYFDLKEKEFKGYVRNKSGIILDYRFVSVLILWGSSYVYDYLKLAKLIEATEYENVKKTIKSLKESLIKENSVDLWRYDFVHNWERSKMVSEEEQKTEQEIFKKSLNQKEGISDKNDGFFIESQAEIEERLFGFEESMQESQPAPKKRKLPKIGRNERVTVKYKDGTIKEQIKFKRVKEDLEKGNCEMI